MFFEEHCFIDRKNRVMHTKSNNHSYKIFGTAYEQSRIAAHSENPNWWVMKVKKTKKQKKNKQIG